jgi:hypothetical protein
MSDETLIFAYRFDKPEAWPAEGEWKPTEGGDLAVEVGGARAHVTVVPCDADAPAGEPRVVDGVAVESLDEKVRTAFTVRFEDRAGSEPFAKLCGGYSGGMALAPGDLMLGIQGGMAAGAGARLFFACGGDARVVTVAADRSVSCAVASVDEALDPE